MLEHNCSFIASSLACPGLTGDKRGTWASRVSTSWLPMPWRPAVPERSLDPSHGKKIRKEMQFTLKLSCLVWLTQECPDTTLKLSDTSDCLYHHHSTLTIFESQGKPKNTEVGSLSHLQRIFPTQESNWGLLHCRWILYQLSYQLNDKSKVSFGEWQNN